MYPIATKKLTQKVEKVFAQNPFGLFNESILEQCNHTFSLMYHHVFKGYWHTSMDARMPRNYCTTQWQNGTYEVYIPTRSNMENNIQYYRITVKVLPELDWETVKEQLPDSMRQTIRPNGIVDSELIVFIAPKRSEKARKERQFLRGFRHIKKRGYLTAIVINPIPEICMKRMLTLIANFLKTRIKKLLEKLNFQPWQYDYKGKEYLYYSKLVDIIESFSYSIATTLRSLSHSLNWILMKLKHTLRQIGRQSMAKMAINKFFELKTLLKDMRFSNPQIVKKLELLLVSEVKNAYWVKKPLPQKEWRERSPKVKLKLSPLEQAILFPRIPELKEGKG